MSPVVEAARRWLGTPYVHQASTRGAGADCLGLVRGVWRELHGDEPEPVPAYTPDWGEPGGEDVLLFRMREGAVAKHLGIHAGGEPARFIHAYSGHGVVESALCSPWRRRIVAVFEFPDGGN